MRGKGRLLQALFTVIITISILLGNFGLGSTVEAGTVPYSYGQFTYTINPVDLRNPQHKKTIDFKTYGKPVLLFFGDPVSCYNSKYTLRELCDLYNKNYFNDEVTVCIYEIKDKTNKELLDSVSAVPEDFYVMQLSDCGYRSPEYSIYSKIFDYCSGIDNSITMPLLAYIDTEGNLVDYSSSLQTADSLISGLIKAGASVNTPDLPLAVIEGTKKYDKANELLKLINSERAKKGLSPLGMNTSFTNDSMQRAVELIFNRNTNTRPNYMPIQTLNSDFVYETSAEFFDDAADVVNMWVKDSDSYTAMMSEKYQSVGIGVVEIEGVLFWTCDYSFNKSSGSINKDNEVCEFKVEFPDGGSVDSYYDKLTVYEGEKKSLSFYTYTYYGDKYSFIPIKRLEKVNVSASKPNLVTVDNNVISALQSGTDVTVRYTADNGLDISVVVELKSKNSSTPVVKPTVPAENSGKFTTKWIDEETGKEVTSYDNVSMVVLTVSPAIDCGYYVSYKDDMMVWKSNLYNDLDYATISTFEMRDDWYGDYYLDEGTYEIVFVDSNNNAVVKSSVKVSKTKPDPINQNMPSTTPVATSTPSKTPTVAPTTTAKPTAKPTSTVTVKPTVVPADKPETAPSVEDFAERLYTTCLGRDAEKDGKDYWTNELKGGKPGSEVAEGFFFSPEFIGQNLSDSEYITRLYRTFMGREPDKAGIDYWSSEMKSGKDRKFVFDGFVNSTEWADICLTYGIRSGGTATPTFEKKASADVKAFAERLYTTCLGREAEKAGLEWWASELANLRQTGTVAAQGFFFSPEFLGLKTNDDEYVTRLYKTFMGREPESAGFKYWVGELKAGKDRQYVFDGFSVAPEFANLCAEAGIMR